jgi:hypothetical protein
VNPVDGALRLARSTVRAGAEVSARALLLAGHAAESVLGRLPVGGGERSPPSPSPPSPDAEPKRSPVRRPDPIPPPPAPRSSPPVPPVPDTVKTIDDAPEFVAEFADSGVEDGVGAEVHVGEPWPDYNRLNAAEVRARLATSDSELCAAALLFEPLHRNRRTVVEAAERRLRELRAG